MNFSDNSVKNADDKLHEVFPVINKINDCLRLVPIEECLAVDKQIIPLKAKDY